MTVTGPDIVPDAHRADVGAHQPVSLTYEPALDGLRGLAVLGVLLFHGEFSWAEGGYLGVSTFFTLSGFLITSLLLAEQRRDGAVSLRRFWTRRVRRLMPASLVALALACAFGLLAADANQLADLRGDVLSALAYVANWRFILDGQSYADLFSGPSPVLQFWSLAIEEQFYALYPLVVVAVLAASRRAGADPRARLGAVLALLTAASVLLSVAGVLSDDVVYLSTPTRAAELLVGCLLAVVLSHRSVRSRVNGAGAGPVGVIGGTALVVVLVTWATVPQDSAWLYRGGFAAYSLLSVAVIVAAVAPTPVRAALAWEPLRRLGLVSYGLYLYHWPIFLWLDASTELEGWSRFVVGASLATLAAVVSARWLEQPVRRQGRLGGVRASTLAPVAVVAVVAATLAVTVDPPPPLVDEAAARASLEDALATNSGGGDDGSTPSDGAAPTVPRVGMYGDSTAMVLSAGFFTWVAETPSIDGGPGSTGLGCPLTRGGELRVGGGERPLEEWCSWSDEWVPQVREDGQDIAVVLSGPWDVADRRREGSTEWEHLGQADFDDWTRRELVSLIDAMAAEGATVVLLTSPPVVDERNDLPRRDETVDPARMDRWNELLAEAAAARPEDAHLVDLAGWLDASGRDAEYRPDGIHLTDEGSYAATVELLGPAVLAVWEDVLAG